MNAYAIDMAFFVSTDQAPLPAASVNNLTLTGHPMPPGLVAEGYDVWRNGQECVANQICNGGFEQDVDFWQLDGETELVSPGYSGNYALRSVQTRTITQTASWAGVRQSVSVVPGQIYDYRAWLKWENAQSVHMKVEWYDGGTFLGSSVPMSATDGDSGGWVMRGSEVTAPPGAALGVVTIWHGVQDGNTNATGSTLWIDDVTFRATECSLAQLCNRNFEQGIDSWIIDGTIEIVTPSHNDSNALRSTQTRTISQTASWAGIRQSVSVVSGQIYDYSAWLKWENASQVHMKVEWYNGGTFLGSSAPMSGTDGDSGGWVMRGSEVTAPSNATLGRVVIWHGVQNGNTNATGSTLWIDDVSFRAVPAVGPVPNAHTVAASANIMASFTAPISPTSVTSQSFVVHSGF